MKKSDVIKVLQTRIDKLTDDTIYGNPTKEELQESITRTDEIRNIACLLGGLDFELN